MKARLATIAGVVKQGSGALLPAFLLSGLLSACATTATTAGQEPAAPRPHYPAIDIAAQGETAPVGTGNADAADDPAIWRNAADPAVLQVANPVAARCLFVAIPDAFEAGSLVEEARRINPALTIIARAHSDAEEQHLQRLGATSTILGERELALEMLRRAGL